VVEIGQVVNRFDDSAVQGLNNTSYLTRYEIFYRS
jgi:hypothetical protein